ncbi:MAG: hypothetical protein JWN07_2976 [Hyphomicrobiales bacterium]|nr:hypothetical protein [Hyphomicrobiales bacterium]
MRKTYRGYALPTDNYVASTIDWSCKVCGSAEVDRDPHDVRPLHWCDGGPSMEDDLREWVCHACGYRARGREFAQGRTDVE